MELEVTAYPAEYLEEFRINEEFYVLLSCRFRLHIIFCCLQQGEIHLKRLSKRKRHHSKSC